MKEIKLTNGYVALIDDEDYERVSKYKWQAENHGNGLRVYAITTMRFPNKHNVRLHRFILNAEKEQLVDHINGNQSTLDCRKSNLRIATKSENGANSKISIKNTSGYKGISFHKETGKWRARIVISKKCKSLGLYQTAELASIAYNTAYKEQWGKKIF